MILFIELPTYIYSFVYLKNDLLVFCINNNYNLLNYV